MLCQILLKKLGTSAPTEVLFSYLNGRIEPGDRFLIIDEMVYHFGASIKALGKKWFAVSLMTEYTPEELLLEPAGEDPAALVVSFPFSCLG